MHSLIEPISLRDQDPVGAGSWKLVYQHPDDERLLVKVMKRDGKVREMRTAWYQATAREGDILLLARELREFVAAEANATGRDLPIPRIIGLAQTDLGLGLVVEKICGRDGQRAMSLEVKLREAGLTPEIEKMLAHLIAEINRHRIVIGEIKAANILFAEDDRQRVRLVLVDGFGETSLIPLHSLSEFANTRRNMQKYRGFIRRVTENYRGVKLRSPADKQP